MQIDEVVSADMALVPFKEIIRLAKHTPLMFKLFLFPFIVISYFICKIFKKPLYSNTYLSRFPKIKVLPRDSQKDNHKYFRSSNSYLTDNGFIPLFDFEDLSRPTKNCCRLFVNKEKSIYAEITSEIKYSSNSTTTFLAYTAGKKAVVFANDFEHSLFDPPGLIRRNFPGMTVQELFGKMRQKLSSIGEKTILIMPGNFFILRQKIRSYLTNQSLKKGYFFIRPKEKQIMVCSNHSMLAAESTCSICNTPLCTGCKREYKYTVYCENCLPAECKHMKVPLLPEMAEGYLPAGFGIRTVAALLDLIIFTGILGALIYTTAFAAPLVLAKSSASRVTWFIGQLYMVLFFVFYLSWPLLKFGRTPGQAVFGLKTVDRRMNVISRAGVFVRIGYHLLSFLFIFPIAGYFFSLFNKKKQGLHDKISGTFVITRKAMSKAIAAWLLLFLIGGGTIGAGSTQMGSVFSFIYNRFFNLPEPTIVLQPVWQTELDNSSIVSLQHQDLIYVYDYDKALFQALSSKDGGIVWQQNDVADYSLLSSPDFAHDIMSITTEPASGPGKIMLLSNLDGAVIWEEKRESDIIRQISGWGDFIFFQSGSHLRTFDMQGRLLWEKDFNIKQPGNFSLNGEVVADFYNDETEEITRYYLSKTDGKTLWQKVSNGYGIRYGMYRIGNGFLCKNNVDNETEQLLRLSDQKVIWEVSDNDFYSEHLITSKEISETTPHGLLYGRNKALRIENGQVAFNYPKGFSFLQLSKDFIILVTQNDNRQKRVQKKELLMLDRESGEKFVSTVVANVDLFQFLEENQDSLFFMTSRYEDKNMINRSNDILIINKKTGKAERKEIGKNLNMVQIDTTGEYISISTGNSVGTYHL